MELTFGLQFDQRAHALPEWILGWWDVYGRGTGRELRVGTWFDGARLVGLALLQRRVFRCRRILPFRRLELLGADVDEDDGVDLSIWACSASRSGSRPWRSSSLALCSRADLGPGTSLCWLPSTPLNPGFMRLSTLVRHGLFDRAAAKTCGGAYSAARVVGGLYEGLGQTRPKVRREVSTRFRRFGPETDHKNFERPRRRNSPVGCKS